jgi:catechol 2,3-dioxygenase-like lactoylglutathione lyase family enzyme
VDEAITFYKTLGLRLIVKALPHYARFECPDGDATFSIHYVEELDAKSTGAYIYFESSSLDTLVDELKDKGVKFDEFPEDKRWLWREARLRDPDGNVIILYHAGKNRKNPPWRIEEGMENHN